MNKQTHLFVLHNSQYYAENFIFFLYQIIYYNIYIFNVLKLFNLKFVSSLNNFTKIQEFNFKTVRFILSYNTHSI